MWLLLQFEGQEIALDPKVGIFVTMNPGYTGCIELPESLKALFRPVVCIVPDLELICFISLFSEGFLQAKVSSLYLPFHCLVRSSYLSFQAKSVVNVHFWTDYSWFLSFPFFMKYCLWAVDMSVWTCSKSILSSLPLNQISCIIIISSKYTSIYMVVGTL
jgi:hypothetical protein